MQVLAVPVKSLERTKSRLASILSLPERAALTLAMMEDVLEVCLAQPAWEVWVVSVDEAVLEVAARRGVRPIAEEGSSLNEAIRQVERETPGRPSSLAVVLADLPFITGEALAAALARDASVVAAPAASDGGTNLLLRHPPAVIPPRFGPESFAKHRWAARRARIRFEEIARSELAFDLDRPHDMARVLAANRPGRTLTACLEMGLPGRLRSRAERA